MSGQAEIVKPIRERYTTGILIKGTALEIWACITEQKYIRQWEGCLSKFKELFPIQEFQSIIHWDIENDLDFLFSIRKTSSNIFLEVQLLIKNELNLPDDLLKEQQIYIQAILPKIKKLVECDEKIH